MSTSKAKTGLPSPAICTNRSTMSPAGGTPRFFGPTAGRSGPITPNLTICRSFARPTGMSSFTRTRAGPAAMGRSSRRPFGPSGAIRTSKTTWPWWTTPLSRELRTRQNLPSVAGPMAVSRPISSLRRPTASKPPFRAQAAPSSRAFGHDEYQRDYETELGHPWENKAVWEKLSPFYRVNNITTPTLFMGGDIDWNFPILVIQQMYLALKRQCRTTELVVYPGVYHGFKTTSQIHNR